MANMPDMTTVGHRIRNRMRYVMYGDGAVATASVGEAAACEAVVCALCRLTAVDVGVCRQEHLSRRPAK